MLHLLLLLLLALWRQSSVFEVVKAKEKVVEREAAVKER